MNGWMIWIEWIMNEYDVMINRMNEWINKWIDEWIWSMINEWW